MKKMIWTLVALTLSLGLSACNKSDSSKKLDANKAANEILNKPVAIEPGTYQIAIQCVDKSKQANVPNVKMVYQLKADGSYVESAEILDSRCTHHCAMEVVGTYHSTATKFTFNQKTATSQGETKQAEETVSLSVMGFDNEKGQIILMDENSDNACEGKMLWVMVKQ